MIGTFTLYFITTVNEIHTAFISSKNKFASLFGDLHAQKMKNFQMGALNKITTCHMSKSIHNN